MIVPKDLVQDNIHKNWGTFEWIVTPFGLKNPQPTNQCVVNKAFKEYLDIFMKLYFDVPSQSRVTCEATLQNLDFV